MITVNKNKQTPPADPLVSSDDITDKYHVSLVVNPGWHSFIVVSKQRNGGDFFPLASFGLYGANDCCFKSHVVSCGLTSGEGRIRSEQFLLKEYRRKLIGKKFPISQEQAMSILKQGVFDANINRIERPKSETNYNIPPETGFTAEEKAYSLWFLTSRSAQGGPRFNGLDFNCHKYALYILRSVGIKDAYLESFAFPLNEYQLPRFINTLSEDKTDEPVPIKSFPVAYDRIFCSAENPIQGTIALLKDYFKFGSHFFHPKRHYRSDLIQVLKKIEDSPQCYLTIKSIIKEVESTIPEYRYYGGSMQRRLDYLELKSQFLDSKEEQFFEKTDIEEMKYAPST